MSDSVKNNASPSGGVPDWRSVSGAGVSNAAPLRSEFADDPDMAEIIDAFVSEMPQRVNKLVECWHGQQLDELRRLSHQLKGASGGYGFSELGQIAGKFEHTINALSESGTKDPMTGLRSEFEALLALCKRVGK